MVLYLQRRGIDTSAFATQNDKEDFLEVVTSELLLEMESLDRLKELYPFEILLRSKSGVPLPDWSSIVTKQEDQPTLLLTVPLHLILLSLKLSQF